MYQYATWFFEGSGVVHWFVSQHLRFAHDNVGLELLHMAYAEVRALRRADGTLFRLLHVLFPERTHALTPSRV